MASGPTRVLVVEDQDYLREMVVDILSEYGYPALGLADPFIALTQVMLLAPELVVLDMWMPTMSGVTFLNRLRREPRFSVLPVIVVSGDRSFAADVLSDAHVEFMLKPFEAAVLVERTRALIGPPLSIPA
jgi:DNA-binding response OmpR family regulator